MKKRLCFCFLIAISAIFSIKSGNANNLESILEQSKISGNLRTYYINKYYLQSNISKKNIFSFNGQINVLSGDIYPGWKIGTSVYFATSIRTDKNNQSNSFNNFTLNQAYIQYQNKYVFFKVGNQIIDTPWLNPSNTAITPTSYLALYGNYTPNKDLKFTALQVFHFNDNTCDTFSTVNLYNTDSMDFFEKMNRRDLANKKVSALGMQYSHSNITSQAWYYHFHDLANLAYTDINYEAKTNFNPQIGLQFLREWSAGDSLSNTYSNGTPNALGLGVIFGAKKDNLQLSIGYNYIPTATNTFHQGNVLSPYTAGGDPLYTTSMLAGLIEKAPGQAVKITGNYFALDNKLQISASYAKYFTAPLLSNSAEFDLDTKYLFSTPLKGLSLRHSIAIMTVGSPAPLVYNRLTLQYNF